jgi:hypothetical protein
VRRSDDDHAAVAAHDRSCPRGREVALRFFEGEQLIVYDRDVQNYFTVAPNETDLMAQVPRAAWRLPGGQRAALLVRSLGGRARPGGAWGRRCRWADADYVLVFAGRLGCTRCAAFAPTAQGVLRAGRGRAAPAGSRFELVLLPEDGNAEAAAQVRWPQVRPAGRCDRLRAPSRGRPTS